jgi:prepilin-type processing-associated H-X9-DG protein
MKSSFTLTELLITFAVVLIISSMLSPVAAKAYSSTVNVECKSHLRQLGLNTIIYANAHNNLLPHEDAGSTKPPYDKAWYQVLRISWHERGIPLNKGFNIKMNDRIEDYGTPRSPVFRNLQTIKHPVKTPYLFDSKFSANTPKGIYSSASGHHEGTSNFLMLDNHVENIFTSSEQWQKDSPLFWDPDVSLDDQKL